MSKKLYITQVQGVEDYSKMVGTLVHGLNRDTFKMYGYMLEVTEHGKKTKDVDTATFANDLATAIGEASAPMNKGKAIGPRMVQHYAKIAAEITADSIGVFGDCGHVGSLRALASAKKVSRTMKNEIVRAIGEAGGVYSDADLLALAKFAKSDEAQSLSAGLIVEKMGPGCAKGEGSGGSESGAQRAMNALREKYEEAFPHRAAKAPNANTHFLINTILPEWEA